MKQIFSLFLFLTLNIVSHAQKDVIDNVVIQDDTERDTTATLYTNIELNWTNKLEASGHYEFVAGDKAYLEVIIDNRSKAKDGSWKRIIIVQLDDPEAQGAVPINMENTTQLIKSTWRHDPFVTDFSGTLDLQNGLLKFETQYDMNRNMLHPEETIPLPKITRIK